MSTKNYLFTLLAVMLGAYFLVSEQHNTKQRALKAITDFPVKAITIIVPFSAGTGSDLLARALEPYFYKYLGQPAIVVNKPGGGATIAWNELASSRPDGYTLGITTTSVNLQPLYGPLPYHYPSALQPLAQITTMPLLLAVRADQPWQTINEVVDYARQNPGVLSYGYPGIGTAANIIGEMFVQAAQADIRPVPFLGTPEALAATLGGHIQLLIAGSSDIKEHVKSGKLRVLAVAGDKRLTMPEYASVPTFKEKALDVDLTLWQGISAPKPMPDDVKQKLSVALQKIATDPELVQKLEALGYQVEYLSSEQLADKWSKEGARLSKVVAESDIAERIKAQKK